MDIEWTNESIIQLVEEYKKLPELWDKNHDLYRVHSAKYDAWSSLAEKFSCDIVDLRKKFNSIFASRRREKAKIRGGGRSTWFLYNRLNFLSGHLDKDTDVEYTAKSTSSYRMESDHVDSDDQDQDQDQEQEHELIVIKKEPQQETFRREPSRPYRRLTRTIRRKPKENTQVMDNKLSEMVKLLRKSSISKKKDECDTFGEYIASSLRKHDEKTQSMIKQAINNILFEQEMKKYNTSPYTVIISTSEENPLGTVQYAEDILSDDGKKDM